MKGEIQTDHMPTNKYTLQVAGLITIVTTEVSGIEEELETVELPDRTIASGGQRKATEFTMMTPMHHSAERVALEAWYQEAHDPVTSTYKKPCTLTVQSLSGSTSANYTLSGVFIKGRNLPDLSKTSEGDMAMIEWTLSVDDILPL